MNATDSSPRLTQQVKAGGCASKLAPGTLAAILGRLPAQQDPNLLVGFDTSDDAGIYRISPDLALVQTVDFFTPMVDDPFTYGRIAATNALSDIYAMGGRALTALSLVCFPQDGDPVILEQILRGGLTTMQQAGCTILGGHSVRDAEIKFGYAVTGLIHPDRVLKNTGAQPGDVLVFTKALGTGVITTALKQNKAQPAWIDAAVDSMTTSNRLASEIALRPEHHAHGMTDVTGFGLMGHARELALGSGVQLRIHPAAVNLLQGALDAVALGCVPAGLHANRDFAECIVHDAPGLDLDDARRALLYDPQTAGGLLLSVAPSAADTLLRELHAAGYLFSAIIGTVEPGHPGILLAPGHPR